MFKNVSNERVGELYVLLNAILWSVFPALTRYSVQTLPPVFFAGLTAFLAGVIVTGGLLVTKKIAPLYKKAWIDLWGIIAFIIVIPSIFIFIGTKETSAINTAILLQSEVVFTLIIFGFWGKEKITQHKLIGALIVLIGATLLTYQSPWQWNKGDLLIIAGTLFYPFGNLCGKKILKEVPVLTIIGLRNFIGGLLLMMISFFIEKTPANIGQSLKDNLIPITILVFGILIIEKIFWYEGIKRIDVTKALTIGASAPAFALISAFLVLHEIPTLRQGIGLLIVTVGVLLMIKKGKITISSDTLPV